MSQEQEEDPHIPSTKVGATSATSSNGSPPGSCIVIDNGSSLIKAGFAGDELPSVFPSLVSYRKHLRADPNPNVPEFFVCDEPLPSPDFFRKYPITRGVVTDWNGMETIWRHFYRCQSRILRETKRNT